MRLRDSFTPGMLIPLLVVTVLVTVVAVGLRASSGLRAYVGGESLWTKSQKSGVIALGRFVHTAHPADWVAYEDSRAIPEADRRARLALQRDPPDIAAAVTGFIAGGNHPDDARAMQWLFRVFAGERHLQRAVGIWTEGDRRRDELHVQALALRALVEHSAPEDSIRPVLDSIAAVDGRLTLLERDFSATLAEAGRWLHRVVLLGTSAIGLLLAAFGAFSLSRLTREERRAYLLAQQRDAERLASERALRERDEQLRQAQKMEAVGRLAGGIAHDFNNLLTIMRGNLELLRTGITPGTDAEEDLRETARAVDRAAALTSQLLTFSRQRAPDLQPLRLHEAVAAAQPMLLRALGDQVRLSVDIPEDLPPILGDAAQLEQVLLNLAVNARDAMPDGGSLRLRAMRRFGRPSRVAGAAILADASADWVTLEVSDSGTGVPEELRDRIFEPFFTTKEVGKGTGLGLATTYGIVVGFGGAIEVAASDFGGAAFTLWLPPTEQSAPEPRPMSVTAETDVSASVLVVEDQPEVRRLTSRILRRAGYHVVEATNGREALELLAREPGTVDLLVTDVVMPELGGRGLAEALQKKGTPLPTVFISGYSPDQEPLRDPYGREVEVLTKPFRADDLIERVRTEIARARAVRADA